MLRTSTPISTSRALVYSDAKAGRDVGDVCGIGPIGITATKDPDEIVALDADCVRCMPQSDMNPMGRTGRRAAAGR